MPNASDQNPSSELILYQTEDQQTHIQVRLEGGTVWLTQKQMSELFQTTPQNITQHLKSIFIDGELDEMATCKDYLLVRREGSREISREMRHYNMDAILAVGYRVRSSRGTQFRQWATVRLKEYLVKGFVLDDERLKTPPGPNVPDYFDELIERIRDIRASEKRMYLRVREILALAADYKPEKEETQAFFQTVQNKLHFAATGKTAPELIAERANAQKSNMGLMTWKGAVVRKSDVTIAKNYLQEKEITELNRIVTMFLDFAEDQARRRKQVFMCDWRSRLDDFLRFNEREVLDHAGCVSREEADRRANEQYALFEKRRRAEIEAKAAVDFSSDLKALEDRANALAKSKPKRKKPGKS